MIVKLVNVEVRPEMRDLFVDATLENQASSRLEEGIAIFDFYQSKDDPNKFILYESYRNDDAMKIHSATDHYKKWAAAIEACFSKPRERAIYVDVQKGVDAP